MSKKLPIVFATGTHTLKADKLYISNINSYAYEIGNYKKGIRKGNVFEINIFLFKNWLKKQRTIIRKDYKQASKITFSFITQILNKLTKTNFYLKPISVVVHICYTPSENRRKPERKNKMFLCKL